MENIRKKIGSFGYCGSKNHNIKRVIVDLEVYKNILSVIEVVPQLKGNIFRLFLLAIIYSPIKFILLEKNIIEDCLKPVKICY